MAIEFREDAIAGDWRAAIGKDHNEASRATQPLPSAWEMTKQSWLDARHRTNSNAAAFNASEIYDEVNDRIKSATGKGLINPLTADILELADRTQGATVKRADDLSPLALDYWKSQIEELRKSHPNALAWDDILTEPDRRAFAKMKEINDATEKMGDELGMVQGREIPYIRNVPLVREAAALSANAVMNPGATAGQLVGGFAGAMTSPLDAAVNLIGFGAGGKSLSLLNNAVRNAAANAVGQMPLSALKMGDYEKAGLPHGWNVWLSEVEGAASAGAVLDTAFRAPMRAIRRAAGDTNLGGVVFDAVPETGIKTPSAMPQINPDTYKAAQAGDLKATREILEATGAMDDPEIRGAFQHAEAFGKLDSEQISRLEAMGVARPEGIRILDGVMQGRYTRPADLDLDIQRKNAPLEPRISDAQVDRVVAVARTDLDAIQPGLSEFISAAVESRVAEIEGPVRAALARLDDKDAKQSPAIIARDLQDKIRQVLADPAEAERIGNIVRLGQSSTSPVDIARMIQASPEIKRHLNPEISRDADGLALATLDETNLSRVASGEVELPIARHIANHVRPEHQARAFDDVAKARPESLDEAIRLLDELVPDEPKPDMPLDRSGGLDDPIGAEAKARTEAMKKDAAEAVKAAQEPIKEVNKLDSKAESLKGEIAKLEEKPLKDASALAIAKKRAELHEAETDLAGKQAALHPDPEAARALYDVAMASVAKRRAMDVHVAVAHAVVLGRAIAPGGTRIEVRAGEMRDPVTGNLLDAYYDKGNGTIVLASYALDPAARVSHEVVHALVDRGALTAAEVQLLAKDAGAAFSPEQRGRYAEAYKDRPNLEALLDEEAAAHAIDARVKGTVQGPANTVANRMAQLIKRMQNLLNGYGFKTADDVMAAILSGEAAKSAPVRQWMRENDVSAMAVKADARIPEGYVQAGERDGHAIYARPVNEMTGMEVRHPDYIVIKDGKSRVFQGDPENGTSGGIMDQWFKAGGMDGRFMFSLSDRETGQSMRRDMDALGYYSKLDDVLAGLGPKDRVTAATLQQKGVKLAELEARGLMDGLNAGPQSVSDLMARAGQNKVGLKEAIYQNGKVGMFGGTKPASGAAGPAKWDGYSLDPTNPTYRETVLHLPAGKHEAARDLLKQKVNSGRMSHDQYNAEIKRLGAPMKSQDFKSGHFDEPNIVGHMMTSMNQHQGKPVYTVDQIQSDWGQKLRDGGVRDEAKIASARYAAEMAIAERNRLGQEIADAGWSKAKESELDAAKRISPELGKKLDDAARELRLRNAELAIAEASSPGNPLVNTTDQWTNTTLRRALRQAAEADAEYIAIPSGDTVLSYNPGDTDGMKGFYDGIVPKNLRNILQKIDKNSPAPEKIDTLDTPTKGAAGKGFTLFRLTPEVKRSVINDGQVMFAFAGERARTADLEALAKAKDLDAAGTDRTKIWTDTGWFRGVDGKWRFEIDDSTSPLTPEAASIFSRGGSETGVADNVLAHDGIYTAYPSMAEAPTHIYRGDSRGSFSKGDITVSARGPREGRSVMLHELQHGVQEEEGTARGGSPEHAATPMYQAINRQLSDLAKQIDRAKTGEDKDAIRQRYNDLMDQRSSIDDYAVYKSLAGEVEARAVQSRMDLTADQRRARPPWLDYDVPEDQQIVRFADGTAKSEPMFALADNDAQPPKPILEQEYATMDRMYQIKDLIEACAA